MYQKPTAEEALAECRERLKQCREINTGLYNDKIKLFADLDVAHVKITKLQDQVEALELKVMFYEAERGGGES